jgi:hypothetical protein
MPRTPQTTLLPQMPKNSKTKLSEKFGLQSKQKLRLNTATTLKQTHLLKLVPTKTSSGTSIVTASHHAATTSGGIKIPSLASAQPNRSKHYSSTSEINSEP